VETDAVLIKPWTFRIAQLWWKISIWNLA